MAIKNVKSMNYKTYEQLVPDSERYVVIHSQAFDDVYTKHINATTNPNILEGLVKISKNGKTIYRKCIARKVPSVDTIELGYRSMAEIEVTAGQEVEIKPACWFGYLWNNSESQVKFSFISAFVCGVLTVIFGILSIILTIYYSNGCCCQ